MIVRIRLSYGPRVNPDTGQEKPRREASEVVPLPERAKVSTREATQAASVMLAPVCWCAWAMAFWRLGADMGIAGAFCLNEGLFSHWQVWFALGAGLQVAAGYLRRQKLDNE